VRASADGMPADDMVVPESGFAALDVAPDYWHYKRFELKNSIVLAPWQGRDETLAFGVYGHSP